MADDPLLPKGTLLIVDDEVDTVFFISKIFQPQGYHTLTANNGVDALKYIRELGYKIDLVLLDLRMPEMGGSEVLKVIRREHRELPVIVLTAFEEDRAEIEKIGVDAFMTKPYSLQELYDKVTRVLENRAVSKETVEMRQNEIPTARVLIIDDEQEVCAILSEVLSKDVTDAVFEVRTAHDGRQALRVAAEFEPDIVIVDIKMPFMWGDELVERLKRGEAGAVPRDFIIFTLKDDEEERAKAEKAGNQFLPKTAKFDDIIKLLKRTCVKHQLMKRKSK